MVGRQSDVEACRASIDRHVGVVIAGPAGVGKTRLARELADAYESERSVLRVAPGSMSIPLSALSSAGGGTAAPIVVLDDIQQLDDDAAALVLGLAMRSEIVLIATLRTREDAPRSVVALWKDDYVERIDIGRVDRVHVDEILDTVLDSPIDAAARRSFWDSTRGSPLMLRELVRAAVLDGSLVRREGLWCLDRAPQSIRLDELVGTRLDELDRSTLHVIEIVALGEPVAFEPLVDAVGVDALSGAEASGLVEAVKHGLRREVRMAHPVYADVARRRIGEARTVAHLHQLLEFLNGTPLRRRDDIVRSVTWQLRAGGTAVSADMVLAARRALYDRQEQLAIDLASRADGAEAGLILGVAFADRGEHERADAVLRELDDPDSDAHRALIAIQRADALFWGLGRAEETDALLADAEHEAPPGPWHDALTATRAVMASNQGRIDEALALIEPLLARDVRDRAFVTASIAGVAALALSGRGERARELARTAYATREDLGDQLALADQGMFVILGTMAARHLGRLDDAEATSQLVYDITVGDGRREGQGWSALALGDVALARGRMSEASEHFLEAAGVFASLHHIGPRRWALAGATMAAAQIGDAAAVADVNRELATVPPHPSAMLGPETTRAEAWTQLSCGDRAGAIETLRRAANDAQRSGSVVLAGMALHDIVRLGESVDTAEWENVAACDGVLAPRLAAFGRAVANNDPDALMQISAEFTSVGADLFAAESAIAAALVHESTGDARAATRCRRVASDAQNRTGEDWFVTLDHAPASISMTPRELDVATRAADGMTSRMIAEELDISVRTVDNHLQRVYEKLGVSGRRELKPALAIL